MVTVKVSYALPAALPPVVALADITPVEQGFAGAVVVVEELEVEAIVVVVESVVVVVPVELGLDPQPNRSKPPVRTTPTFNSEAARDVGRTGTS